MTKFMVLYRSSTSARDQMANATPEQMKAGMEAWMQWAGKAGEAVVDLGALLAPAAHVGPGSSDAGEISGYSIMQADSAHGMPAARTDSRRTRGQFTVAATSPPAAGIPPDIHATTGGAGQRTSVYSLRSSRTMLV